MDFAGRRTTILGLGRHGGGVAAANYCAARGAVVTATDLADEVALADALAALDLRRITRRRLGGHEAADFREAEILVVNPAVRPDSRWVELARQSGATITSEIELFLRACRGHVIAVTGSNGKSTTATMLHEMLATGGRRTWLGGNIGRSLLPDLGRIAADHWVVLELSSFQLTWLNPTCPLPELAVVTNCTANHLDWHPSLEHYVAAKRRLAGIGRVDAAIADIRPARVVLNTDDAELQSWLPLLADRNVPLVSDDSLRPLNVPGLHHRSNARCAAAAARIVGCDDAAIHQSLARFTGLPHRLQPVGEAGGRTFYNDSKATTPEATIAALRAMDRPVWLLAGGYDKRVPLEGLAQAIVERCRGAAFFGAIGERLHQLVRQCDSGLDQSPAATLDDALDWCWARSTPGEAILLSPACASFDQFADYAARGEHFAHLVRQLEPAVITTAVQATV